MLELIRGNHYSKCHSRLSCACRFGAFDLQPDQRRLLADGRAAPLGRRAFDVLPPLVEREGQPVSKNQLRDLVWPGLVIEETNLQVQISKLRKLLGPQAIATIPGRGYRWTLAAEDASAQPARPRWAPPAMSAESAASCVSTELPALYGRSEDLTAFGDLIGHHALITVAGPAGIGKTRLGQAVAHELRDAFADGVRLVELACRATTTCAIFRPTFRRGARATKRRRPRTGRRSGLPIGISASGQGHVRTPCASAASTDDQHLQIVGVR